MHLLNNEVIYTPLVKTTRVHHLLKQQEYVHHFFNEEYISSKWQKRRIYVDISHQRLLTN